MTADDADWWLFDNQYGGIHVGFGYSPTGAKGAVLDSIAESFMETGLSAAAGKRAAYSYHVRLVAGPVTLAEARAARLAWEREDWESALSHARPRVRAAYGLAPKPRRDEAGHDR